MKSDTPVFAHRDGMIADRSYVDWLSDLKGRFQGSQIKAAIRVNSTLLEFYWSLGRDITLMKADSKWGTGFFEQLSMDLKTMFPKQAGFSATNLKYMKRWYQFYNERVVIRQQVADELDDTEKSHQVADFLEMPGTFGQVPWFHHIAIITRCHALDEALFYVNKVVDEGWSRSQLEAKMQHDLFHAQGAAVTNFSKTLPAADSALAQEILKSPYNFEFLAMREGYEERELEDALVKNVTQFLLELGKGFAYVGRQMELRMDEETSFFPDLVFYYIPQKRYVIIELKAVKYTPEFAGKLNFYVTAADRLLRGEGDNPSVGLIICRDANQTIVEWSLQDINKPLGVATYQLKEVVARTILEIEANRRKQK